MKVGIITFHFAHNYGAMLQAYALQKKISQLGHDTYIIDYKPEYHIKKFKRHITWKSCFEGSPKTIIHNIIKKIISAPYQSERYDGFDCFMKKYMRLHQYSSFKDLNTFDVIVLGSDQIWNPNLTGGDYDGLYYGLGAKCKVISYAASNQTNTLSQEAEAKYRILLKNIACIGVREKKLLELLQPLTDKKITLNLDPTLIIDASSYNNLDLTRPCKEKYVMVYEIGYHQSVQDMAADYAKKIGAKVISLTGVIDTKTIKGFDLTASPEKFVAYIKNAECVFTTSFHGTALSVVFNKPFYTIRQNTNGDLRMQSLLEQLNLIDRFVPMGSEVNVATINYNHVMRRLDQLRQESINYLTKELA